MVNATMRKKHKTLDEIAIWRSQDFQCHCDLREAEAEDHIRRIANTEHHHSIRTE